MWLKVIFLLCCFYQQSKSNWVEDTANLQSSYPTFKSVVAAFRHEEKNAPQELLALINTLEPYFESGQIQFSNVWGKLGSLLSYGGSDALLAVLANLGNEEAIDCSLKKEISKAILYLVQNKFSADGFKSGTYNAGFEKCYKSWSVNIFDVATSPSSDNQHPSYINNDLDILPGHGSDSIEDNLYPNRHGAKVYYPNYPKCPFGPASGPYPPNFPGMAYPSVPSMFPFWPTTTSQTPNAPCINNPLVPSTPSGGGYFPHFPGTINPADPNLFPFWPQNPKAPGINNPLVPNKPSFNGELPVHYPSYFPSNCYPLYPNMPPSGSLEKPNNPSQIPDIFRPIKPNKPSFGAPGKPNLPSYIPGGFSPSNPNMPSSGASGKPYPPTFIPIGSSPSNPSMPSFGTPGKPNLPSYIPGGFSPINTNWPPSGPVEIPNSPSYIPGGFNPSNPNMPSSGTSGKPYPPTFLPIGSSPSNPSMPSFGTPSKPNSPSYIPGGFSPINSNWPPSGPVEIPNSPSYIPGGFNPSNPNMPSSGASGKPYPPTFIPIGSSPSNPNMPSFGAPGKPNLPSYIPGGFSPSNPNMPSSGASGKPYPPTFIPIGSSPSNPSMPSFGTPGKPNLPSYIPGGFSPINTNWPPSGPVEIPNSPSYIPGGFNPSNPNMPSSEASGKPYPPTFIPIGSSPSNPNIPSFGVPSKPYPPSYIPGSFSPINSNLPPSGAFGTSNSPAYIPGGFSPSNPNMPSSEASGKPYPPTFIPIGSSSSNPNMPSFGAPGKPNLPSYIPGGFSPSNPNMPSSGASGKPYPPTFIPIGSSPSNPNIPSFGAPSKPYPPSYIPGGFSPINSNLPPSGAFGTSNSPAYIPGGFSPSNPNMPSSEASGKPYPPTFIPIGSSPSNPNIPSFGATGKPNLPSYIPGGFSPINPNLPDSWGPEILYPPLNIPSIFKPEYPNFPPSEVTVPCSLYPAHRPDCIEVPTSYPPNVNPGPNYEYPVHVPSYNPSHIPSKVPSLETILPPSFIESLPDNLKEILKKNPQLLPLCEKWVALLDKANKGKIDNIGSFKLPEKSFIWLPDPELEEEKLHRDAIMNILINIKQYLPNFVYDPDNHSDAYLINLMHQLTQSPNLTESDLQHILPYLEIIYGRDHNINIQQILSLLPKPQSAVEWQYYKLISLYITSPEFLDLYNTLKDQGLSDPADIMLAIFQYLANNPAFAEAVKFYRQHVFESNYGQNIFSLLDFLKEGASSEELELIEILEKYFYSAEFKALWISMSKENLEGSTLLDQVLLVIEQYAKDDRAKRAAHYFLEKADKARFFAIMQRLIDIIPQPSSETEQANYNILRMYMLSDHAFIQMGMFPFDSLGLDNDLKLLDIILKQIIDESNDPIVIEAAEYYLSLEMSDIGLVTMKEIKKTFKISEIFTDVLNIKELDLGQRDAFKKFFAFISNVSPDLISRFTIWDQASTRAEFMKLLFTFFLEQPDVPDNIKENILVLQPLIRITGRAALPP